MNDHTYHSVNMGCLIFAQVSNTFRRKHLMFVSVLATTSVLCIMKSNKYGYMGMGKGGIGVHGNGEGWNRGTWEWGRVE